MRRFDPRSSLQNQNGAALMMAIFALTMLVVIATEIMYETNVELTVSSQAVNQVKAHYAAKAGVEISLLRIHLFKKAVDMLGASAPPGMLDQIWKMPFAWPPIVPEGTSTADKNEIAASVKKSAMQGSYFTTIDSEGGKLDVNDLDSPIKAIADSTHLQIMQIFQQQMDTDENFARKYQGFDFEKLVNNMADWIDADTSSRNGGEESSLYDNGGDYMPPNQPFKTIDELHMVAGMDDQLYDLLAQRLTIFGVKGVNINYASKQVLMSLSPQITDVRADAIIKRRSDPDQGPFKDENDLLATLAQEGVNGNPFRDDKGGVKIPLIFDSEYNFRIHSTGRSGRVQREITAIVYDFNRVKSRFSTFITKAPKNASNPADSNEQGQPPPAQAPNPASAPTPKPVKEPNERPNIVYWNET